VHNITDSNAFTSPVPVLDDGDPVAASQTQPTVQALANRTFFTNSLLAQVLGTDTTATSGGTKTLTAASNERQYFSGSSNENVVLPDETTVPIGKTFFIFQGSTGTLTIKDSGGGTVLTVPPKITSGRYDLVMVTSTNNATSTGNWKFFFDIPGHAIGINSNAAAAAGEVGELMTISASNASWGSANVAQNLCSPSSFTLTPGDWQISGWVSSPILTPDTASSDLVGVELSVSQTSGAFGGTAVPSVSTGQLAVDNVSVMPSAVGNQFSSLVVIPPYAVQISSPITLYLVGEASYSNIPSYSAFLQARRMR
jgi:hypothetical protein